MKTVATTVKKKSNGRSPFFPKGRQPSNIAIREVQSVLKGKPRRQDLLIEFLHLIQDKFGYLSAAHLTALALEFKYTS